MGQLDPGCMGMLNAVMDPAHLGKVGLPIEYLNQSDLVAEMALVSDEEAQRNLELPHQEGRLVRLGHGSRQRTSSTARSSSR
jgi:hypothetical protein